MTRKPNSRALCGLQQCPSSRRVLRPYKGTIVLGKKLPTPEHDPLKPTPPTASSPRTLPTPTEPELVSTISPAIRSRGATTASEEGHPGGRQWQSGSAQTELDSHYVISTVSTRQPVTTSQSPSLHRNEEHVSDSDPSPTSEKDLLAITTPSSDLSPFSNPVTWHLTPFYTPLTEEPETEIHSGSGEDGEQPENKNENDSVIWTKARVPGNDASAERSTEMPLGPLPTPLWGASLSPFGTEADGLLPSQRPTAFKNGLPRAEGMATEKPANTALPGGDLQPAPSAKPIDDLPELPSSMNLSPGAGPVLTEEDAISLIAEGFLLNASSYKQPLTGHSTAYWVVSNWSEVRVHFSPPACFYMENS